MQRHYYVYILASLTKILYVGVTNDLERRVAEHKAGQAGGFTQRYRCNRLVWCEATGDIEAAIAEEKRIKGWTRAKKVALVTAGNPTWRDLCEDWAASDLA